MKVLSVSCSDGEVELDKYTTEEEISGTAVTTQIPATTVKCTDGEAEI